MLPTSRLTLLYVAVLVIKACADSPAACSAYRLDDKGVGLYLFFVVVGSGMVAILLLMMIMYLWYKTGRTWVSGISKATDP